MTATTDGKTVEISFEDWQQLIAELQTITAEAEAWREAVRDYLAERSGPIADFTMRLRTENRIYALLSGKAPDDTKTIRIVIDRPEGYEDTHEQICLNDFLANPSNPAWNIRLG